MPVKTSRRLVVDRPQYVVSRILAKSKAAPNGCLLWQATDRWKERQDYPTMEFDGVKMYVHRAMYAAVYGEVPEGMWVLHHCDNFLCCNPGHLYLGDVYQNNRDIADRDRRKGVATYRRSDRRVAAAAELTVEQVLAIREEYATGEVTQKELAVKHGVVAATIGNIILGKTWGKLTGGVRVYRPRKPELRLKGA